MRPPHGMVTKPLHFSKTHKSIYKPRDPERTTNLTASLIKPMTIQQVIWNDYDYATTSNVFYNNEYASQLINVSMEAGIDNLIKA
jgi:hypothetical protein